MKPVSTDAIDIADARLGVPGPALKEDANLNAVKSPLRRSFEEFLLNDARVPVGRGVYRSYSFQGREALLAVVRVIDRVLGSAECELRSAENNQQPTSNIQHPQVKMVGRGTSPRAEPRLGTTPHRLPCTPSRRGEGETLPASRRNTALGSSTIPLPDAEISLAGGAQFGKTLLELNLAAYLTGQQFRNFGLYLPDDDLVEGIVDSKFRPDVVDQIDWFAKMTQVGKALNRSGKAVNRKGAFLVTDGRRKAMGVVRGLGKVPTAFSMDVAAMDELDDLQPRRMKFVRGRLAASDLRFVLKLGTQRIHGRGMNQAWKDGSQGVFTFACPGCGRMHCAEEDFPGIVRLAKSEVRSPKSEVTRSGDLVGSADCPNPQRLDRPATSVSSPASCLRSAESWDNSRSGTERDDSSPRRLQGEAGPKSSQSLVTSSPTNKAEAPRAGARVGAVDEASTAAREARALPRLTWSGDFKVEGDDNAGFAHEPGNQYYLGCVDCGAELDRTRPIEEHRRPELIRQRKWSFRISQLAIAAIDLSQIVGRFQDAVADPEEMAVFRCDVLALPQSTSQSLTPAVLDRARAVEPFDLNPLPRVREGGVAFGGLDMGDRCWLFAREVSPVGTHGSRSDRDATTETHKLSIFHTLSSSGVPASHQPNTGTTRHLVAYNRLLAAQKIPAGDVVAQAVAQFYELGLTALFIDERPLVNEARAIALALNGLQSLEHWPRLSHPLPDWIELPGGLTWDGRQSRWLNLKCALVRFTKTKLGSGLEHTMVFFEEGGQTKFVPCIACNRFETIDRVVREFLTPTEGVVQMTGSSSPSAPTGHHSPPSAPGGIASPVIRQTPAMWLPRRAPGQPPILDVVEAHFITGSERVKEPDGSLGDYADGCENHLLLANAYSALAAVVCAGKREVQSMSPYFPNSYSMSELGWPANRALEG